MSMNETKRRSERSLLRSAAAALISAAMLFTGSLAFERAALGAELTKVTWALDSFLTTLPQRIAK